MNYLDTSKIRVCNILENNYDIILDEYRNFNFNLPTDPSRDINWELWKRSHSKSLDNSRYDTSDIDWETVTIEPYKKSHSWYGLNVNGMSIWDGIVIAARGKSTPIGEKFFTNTFNILERYDEIISISLARFPANKVIPLHNGYPILNRIHFPLFVPQGDIGFCVNDECIRWTEGKCIAFNDGSQHRAWNNTKEDRFNLIVDVFV